jgi:translation elongation factor EF-4
MELELKIIKKADTYRAGKLSINGKFFAYTIEDKDRGLRKDMPLDEIKAIKHYGVTAIPVGRYKVAMTYSNRFKRYMLQILDVPGFDGIRIHVANTSKDVEGCVGVAYEDSSDGFAGNSAAAIKELEKQVKVIEKKEAIWITIK